VEFEFPHKISDPYNPAKRLPAMLAGAILPDPQRIFVPDGFDNLPAGLRLLRLYGNLKLRPPEDFLA
jgi:hypothetical protein